MIKYRTETHSVLLYVECITDWWSYPASPSKPVLLFPIVGDLTYTNHPFGTLNVALNIKPPSNNGRSIFTKMNNPPWVFEVVEPMVCVAIQSLDHCYRGGGAKGLIWVITIKKCFYIYCLLSFHCCLLISTRLWYL